MARPGATRISALAQVPVLKPPVPASLVRLLEVLKPPVPASLNQTLQKNNEYNDACKKQASLIANTAFAPLIFSRYITACKKQASQTTEHGSAEATRIYALAQAPVHKPPLTASLMRVPAKS